MLIKIVPYYFFCSINITIDWKNIENFPMQFYKTGKKEKGERAYSPLILFKCFVYKNGFRYNPIRNLKARSFLALNNIQDGIMRKDNINAKLTDFEIKRNKKISKYRYIVEQYFGISHLHDNTEKASFTTMKKI